MGQFRLVRLLREGRAGGEVAGAADDVGEVVAEPLQRAVGDGPLGPDHELLPDHARLQLSQIRPLDSELPKTPEYTGYCFLPDGRYAAGVPLSDEMEVREYIDIQREYQHHLMICDSEDSCVFEMTAGKVVFPTREDIERFNKEQTPPDAPEFGGMEMKP